MDLFEDYARELRFAPIEVLRRIESRGQQVLSIMSDLKSIEGWTCSASRPSRIRSPFAKENPGSALPSETDRILQETRMNASRAVRSVRTDLFGSSGINSF